MKKYLASPCPCGKEHDIAVDEAVVGSGVIARLPEFVARYNAKKPFILADMNTFAAAGEKVCAILEENGIAYSKYIFQVPHLEPDEWAVGSAVMHFDNSCDLIIGVGSGVINDIGKILSNVSGKKYIIVGTAPSMDGYASDTSSMARDGVKISLPSHCADLIIGDTDILKNAPEHMLRSGLGDMLAKYVSITEWRIAHIITGEYYCEEVAGMVREALKKCVDNAAGLLKRDETAIEAVFEGLVLSGVAMSYAGVSRPASGGEHYISHIWDMRGLEFGTKVDLHGIQCAMATLITARLYEAVRKLRPDYAKAKAYVDAFDIEKWNADLRALLGGGAEAMITLEKKEGKYDKSTHEARFCKIEANWDAILRIIDEELPSADEIAKILDTIGIDPDPAVLDIDDATAKMSFRASKDIRDKYVLPRLAWDLGVMEDLCELI